MKSSLVWLAVGMASLSTGIIPLHADGGTAPADNGAIIDFKKDSSKDQLKPENNATATLDADTGSVKIAFPAGKGYPGVRFTDPSGSWNLTGYTGVDVEIKNTGSDMVKIGLRVDGGTDWQNSPWDTEAVSIAPGETITAHVTFGQSYGKPGYQLKPESVLAILVFAADPETASSISIKTIKASK